MPSVRDAFLKNRERLLRAGVEDTGLSVEESRQTGFCVRIAPMDRSMRQAADRIAAEPGGDQWQLRPLASVFAATGEEKYAAAARRIYETHMRQHAPSSFTFDEACEMSHGLYPWLATLHVFLNGTAFDDALVEAILRHAQHEMDHVSAHLYRSRNLRITTASCLLLNGLRLGFLPQAQAWIGRGVRAIRDACHRQIMPDGSHLEAVPHYHYCVMGDVFAVFRAARALPELELSVSAERVASTYDYLVSATRPTGWVAGIGDGGYDPPASVAGRGVTDMLEERAAYRRWLGLPEQQLPLYRMFPHAGQVFLRDSWSADATYVTFEATPCRSYHWHPSRNAIQLEAGGRLLLVDPGRFSYTDPLWGVYGMSTPAHSTLNLNGWNQCESPAELRHRSVEGYDVVEGLYAGGYWEGNIRSNDHRQGVYAEHHRTLLWVRGRCIVVIDNLFNASPADKKPTLESVWQFNPGGVEVNESAGRAVTRYEDANLLMLFALRPEAASLRVREGEKDPLRGWVPKAFDRQYIPAPQVSLTAVGHDPWHTDLATVLVPFRGATPPQVEVTATVDPGREGDFYHPSPGMIALRWGDGSTDEVWWSRRLSKPLENRGTFSTDASLVHLRRDASGTLAGGLVVDGTHIEPFAPTVRPEPGVWVLGPSR